MYHNDTKTKTSVVVSYTVKISLLQSKDQDQEALSTCVLCQTQAGKSPPVSRPPLRPASTSWDYPGSMGIQKEGPTAQRDSEQTQRKIKTPASTTTLVRHRTTSPTDMSANWSSQIGEAKASNWREVGQWRGWNNVCQTYKCKLHQGHLMSGRSNHDQPNPSPPQPPKGPDPTMTHRCESHSTLVTRHTPQAPSPISIPG